MKLANNELGMGMPREGGFETKWPNKLHNESENAEPFIVT